MTYGRLAHGSVDSRASGGVGSDVVVGVGSVDNLVIEAETFEIELVMK